MRKRIESTFGHRLELVFDGDWKKRKFSLSDIEVISFDEWVNERTSGLSHPFKHDKRCLGHRHMEAMMKKQQQIPVSYKEFEAIVFAGTGWQGGYGGTVFPCLHWGAPLDKKRGSWRWNVTFRSPGCAPDDIREKYRIIRFCEMTA